MTIDEYFESVKDDELARGNWIVMIWRRPNGTLHHSAHNNGAFARSELRSRSADKCEAVFEALTGAKGGTDWGNWEIDIQPAARDTKKEG